MFPLEQINNNNNNNNNSGLLVEQNSPIVFPDDFDHNLLEELLESSCEIPSEDGKKKAKALPDEENKEEGNNDKRVMHRDIERRRRKEMAGLYASLRSLLPLEYIKGRRSVSDQMHQATIYIEDLQNKIKELRIRRDKFKSMPSSSIHRPKKGRENNNIPPLRNHVIVNPCINAVEILISIDLQDEGFRLSRVLKELLALGLNVVSCVSTNVNGRSLHKIQSEIQDLRGIDLSLLQQRIANVIN